MSGVCHFGDCREVMRGMIERGEKVQMCVTSPPYFGLRDYGVDGQIGLEETLPNYLASLADVFAHVHELLADDGTLWLNIGDSYAGSWGAQSRDNGNDKKSGLEGGSMLSDRQISEHPQRKNTGSAKNTPGLKPKDLMGAVAACLRVAGAGLVPAPRHHLVEAKPHARERHRSLHTLP